MPLSTQAIALLEEIKPLIGTGRYVFTLRDLTDSTEIGSTYLGKLIIVLQQLLQDKEPQTVIDYLHSDIPNFLEARPLLIDMVD